MTTIEEETFNVARKENIPFMYIDSCLIRSENDDDDDDYQGCSCSSNENCADCICMNRFGRNYNTQKCLNMLKQGGIFECNSQCACSLEKCENRVSQQEDQSKNVRIIETPGKGFGVVLKEDLPYCGTFVGEYIGEVLSETEAHQRMSINQRFEHNYLLLFNEHQSESVIKTFIDARYYGNWTRLINHSCDPNLIIVPIRTDRPSPPHLVFFTRRSIKANEELSYSYGTEIDRKHSKICSCQSSSCTGFLPYQEKDSID